MANIKVLYSNNLATVILTDGTEFTSNPDASFVAANGSRGSNSVKITRSQDSLTLVDVADFSRIVDSDDNQVGTTRDLTVSNLNSNFFNAGTSITNIGDVTEDASIDKTSGKKLYLVMDSGKFKVTNIPDVDLTDARLNVSQLPSDNMRIRLTRTFQGAPTASDDVTLIQGTGITYGLSGTNVTINGFSGDYDDLTNKPTIPTDTSLSDTNQTLTGSRTIQLSDNDLNIMNQSNTFMRFDASESKVYVDVDAEFKNASAAGSIELREATANGTNTVTITVPDSLTSDVTFKLPNSNGQGDTFLKNTGSGVTTWATPPNTNIANSDLTADDNRTLDTDGNDFTIDIDSGSFTLTDGTNNLITNGQNTITITGLQYPNADGTANQVLSTNGSGVIGFRTVTDGSDGADGTDGTNGTDGTGFTGGSYNASTGVVTFTSDDGLGFSTGDLRGADGADGADGTDGTNGTNGTNGVDGADGADGDGFTGGSYDAGTGVVTFTSDDGLGFSTGDLRGADGADGTNGTDGADGADGSDALALAGNDQTLTGNRVINTNGYDLSIRDGFSNKLQYDDSADEWVFGAPVRFDESTGGEIKLREPLQGGVAGVVLKAPNANLTSDVEFRLPSADGSADQVIKTDGSGNLSFVDQTTDTTELANDSSPQLGADLDVNGNKIVSASNGDIVIDPNGTGAIILKSDDVRLEGADTSVEVGTVKLYEADVLGDNFVALKAPISITSDVTFTLPDSDGSDGQVIKTNGSGTLSFTDALDGVNDILTGVTQVKDAGGTRGTVSFYDDAGDNFTALRAADTLSADTVFHLPDADGTDGQFIKTDGSGNLSFGDAGGSTTLTQVYSQSFLDNIGTTLHYLPFKDINEQTTIYQEEAAMLMPFDGKVRSVSIRIPAITGASGNMTIGVHTINTGNTGLFNSGLWTTEETETVAVATTDDHASIHFVFDDAQHFEAGDLLAISIQCSTSLFGASKYVYVSTIIDYDTSNTMPSTSQVLSSNP